MSNRATRGPIGAFCTWRRHSMICARHVPTADHRSPPDRGGLRRNSPGSLGGNQSLPGRNNSPAPAGPASWTNRASTHGVSHSGHGASAPKSGEGPQTDNDEREQQQADDERDADGRSRHTHIPDRAYDGAILPASQPVAVAGGAAAGCHSHIEDGLVRVRAPQPTVDPLLDRIEPKQPREESGRQRESEKKASRLGWGKFG